MASRAAIAGSNEIAPLMRNSVTDAVHVDAESAVSSAIGRSMPMSTAASTNLLHAGGEVGADLVPLIGDRPHRHVAHGADEEQQHQHRAEGGQRLPGSQPPERRRDRHQHAGEQQAEHQRQHDRAQPDHGADDHARRDSDDDDPPREAGQAVDPERW